MQTGNTSLVVSVFKDKAQAQKAIADLEQAGFSSDRIRYSVKRGIGGITDDLRRMGLPEREANFYNNEFEQGRTIVTVDTSTHQEQAYHILMRDGGYDANMGDVRGQVNGPYATTTTTAENYGTTANINPATPLDIDRSASDNMDKPENK